MPKLPMDYSKTIIYKIEHIENDSLVYVGHTTNWDNRKYNNKSRCNNVKERYHNLKVYQMIRENGGWNMFRMIEVEIYPCIDKREAEKRESEVLKELKSSMNVKPSYKTKEEKKISKKEYREKNKLSIKEYYGNYIENNKQDLLLKKKEYREAKKDKIKEYREKNKGKIICECGREISKLSSKRHQSSKKHIDLMKNKI
jgi:hypothetical protein